MSPDTVNIKPGVSVLAVLRHLNYKPWHALAEFVDNSVESFLKHKAALESTGNGASQLHVAIDVDRSEPPRISIRDNAAGIFESELPRAFRPAAIPPDRSGLAEFGMGMKSAACWFAPMWFVRTSALGESVSRTVFFDIENIVNDDIEELTINEVPEAPESHYTEVVLLNVFRIPIGRTTGKIREHLTDIFREFIRDGILELSVNGEVLTYEEPRILHAPFFREKEGPNRIWRKDVAFDLGNGLAVRGFAALRETANTARAGLSLFRRGRLIQGSGEEGYRPRTIFGASNSYRYQRLFGELHLEGFQVSHTKDGFRWDDNEEPFLELLREHLDSEELPLLRQAEGYRVRDSGSRLTKAARQAVNSTTEVMERHLPAVLPALADAGVADTPTTQQAAVNLLAGREFNIRFRDEHWTINVELSDDPAESQWVAVGDAPKSGDDQRRLGIRVSTAHPFMVRFAQARAEDLEGFLRLAAGVALAEALARDSGVRNAGTVRRNLNDILRRALSEP